MSTQSHVLAMLLKQKGEPLSGNVMAQSLNISRTAIWKAINELKKAGHHITSLPNQGYLYLPSDIISSEGINQFRQDQGTDLEIIVAEELASTNQTLKKMAIDGCHSPTLLIAKKQTETRGRFGRAYFVGDSAQGTYFSLLLQPDKKFAEVTQYTLITAVAMARTIEQISPQPVSIKWVNDIYIEGRKVAGILSEAITDFETQSIQAIVIGIGTNFSIPQAAFPDELQSRASSIFPDGPSSVSRNEFIARFIQEFFALINDTAPDYLEEYRQRSFVIGRNVTFRQQQAEFAGQAIGISPEGELIVQLDNGQTMQLSSGEISLTSY